MEVEDDQVELDLTTPAVLDKYKLAGDIANRVMLAVLEFLRPGESVGNVCGYGDKLIGELCLTAGGKKLKDNKGIAFPTCVSINHCAGHFSPLPEDPAVLIKEGDLVKVDLGVHIGGFPVLCAHTWIVGQTAPATGKLSDVVCAAYYASECALHLLRPGYTNTQVTNIIKKCADSFQVRPVEAVLSHEMKHNCLDANNVILNRVESDQTVEEFQFEINQVYCIDIVMSTGEGKTKEIDTRTTVYKRAVDRAYQLKLQASRQILGEISKNSPNHAFSLRALDEKKRRMGIVELVKHELVDSYPVLWEKDGEFIAQFKFTVLILPNQTLRLNGPFPLPHVSSEYSVDQDVEIQQALQLPLVRKKKNKKKKKGPKRAAEVMETA